MEFLIGRCRYSARKDSIGAFLLLDRTRNLLVIPNSMHELWFPLLVEDRHGSSYLRRMRTVLLFPFFVHSDKYWVWIR